MSRLEVGPSLGEARPRLVHPRIGDPAAMVLLLHGGAVDSVEPTRRWEPAGARMRLLAGNLERQLPGFGIYRLIHAVRGWNDGIGSAVVDAEWALMRMAQAHPGVPIGLVGHSAGGRTAYELVARPDVAALVALAPWLSDGYDEHRFLGTPTLIVHGRQDTVTDPNASAQLVARIAGAGGDAHLMSVPGWHSLLWRPANWQHAVATFLKDTLTRR